VDPHDGLDLGGSYSGDRAGQAKGQSQADLLAGLAWAADAYTAVQVLYGAQAVRYGFNVRSARSSLHT
jgi:hypothetical protein